MQIKKLLKEQNAVIIAHYYVDAAIRQLTEETAGCVVDSLQMAQFGNQHPAQTLIVVGVRFIGDRDKFSGNRC